MKLTASIAVLASTGIYMVAAQGGTYTNFTNVYDFLTQFVATNVTLSPYPLCIYKLFCLNLTGNLTAPTIKGARYQIYGRYLGRVVYTESDSDLCASLAAAGTPCPIGADTSTLSLCRNVKPALPANWPVSY